MKATLMSLVAACSLMACANNAKTGATENAPAAETAEPAAQTEKTADATEPQAEQGASEGDSQENTFENGILTLNGVRYDFALVKGGTFTMGASPDVKDAEDCEKPAHEVTIGYNYYIGKTEVTVALWKAVTGNYPAGLDENDLNKPVDNVSQADLESFFEDLGAMVGNIFFIPTEEEWEFAARGGNNSKHYIYSGSNTLSDVAWNEEGNIVYHGYDVTTKKPNELGIYDMSGNLAEWCTYWKNENDHGYVLRGGNCTSREAYCRVSYREDAPEAYVFEDRTPALIGFRLRCSESWEEDMEEEDGI